MQAKGNPLKDRKPQEEFPELDGIQQAKETTQQLGLREGKHAADASRMWILPSLVPFIFI
jgi:hypothetical protein